MTTWKHQLCYSPHKPAGQHMPRRTYAPSCACCWTPASSLSPWRELSHQTLCPLIRPERPSWHVRITWHLSWGRANSNISRYRCDHRHSLEAPELTSCAPATRRARQGAYIDSRPPHPPFQTRAASQTCTPPCRRGGQTRHRAAYVEGRPGIGLPI